MNQTCYCRTYVACVSEMLVPPMTSTVDGWGRFIIQVFGGGFLGMADVQLSDYGKMLE